ncbi:hypothetical protein H310_11170 [Aphanomyces invadans]|uniref:Membrane insertase YidC/Oxa/ALB C-terminal domain-containing protein n=2 Tax=Aphanomyces invadans TaxID=157072 RepID=A0A024TNQ9_9STRA|nr:hypothetical protein H310_11170 [Aphanomyces invadans]ETV95266.1 hypothetical protein H310_11170 [Aphanomyces invadans]|eukprot:XP_008875967.1 hypothetical protein H310_11170 [Aphanomyces invadans]
MLRHLTRRPAVSALSVRHAMRFSSQSASSVGNMPVEGAVPALPSLNPAVPVDDPWVLVDAAQKLIEAVHVTTGLPWWATFGVTAIAVRGTLFPLMVYQIKATERMANASKEMREVWKSYLYARMFLPPAIPQKQVEAFQLMYKGVKLTWEKYQTHPVKCVATPLLQIPTFLLMAYSTRELVRSGRVEGLDTGGVWMFQNLVEADGTLILPALAVGCTYLNFELMGTSKVKLIQALKDKFQYIPLLSFPFICQMPQGIFFYWLASSWCSFAQTMALRQPSIRRALGLRDITASSLAAAPVPSSANSLLPSAPLPTTPRQKRL